MFGYTKLGIELNQYPSPIPDEVICPSDSRLRPDERLYEEGKVSVDTANKFNLLFV